jgi:CubicO group peptidase (beta-lactamase class C family)
MQKPRALSLAFVLGLAASSACAPSTSLRPTSPHVAEGQVGAVLDAFHAAAARADEEAYFGAFAEGGVFLGTDASERWTVAEFRAYAHPHFAKKKAWSFRATRRTVRLAPDGMTAWFDEDLATANLGPARGSGVLVRTSPEAPWKIAHYNLSTVVPNPRFAEVKRVIERPSSAPKTSPELEPGPRFTDPERARKIRTLADDVDAIVQQEYATRHLPSLAVALVFADAPTHFAVAGVSDRKTKAQADRNTVYRVGSITKTFTASLAMQLRDEGKLGLDERLDGVLPEIGKVTLSPSDAKPLTLRVLLTHSSGLPRLGTFDYTRQDKEPSEAEVLGALDVRVVEPPGTRYLYSNFGVATAGLALARVGKKSYRELVAEKLLVPLGMSRSAFEPTMPGVATGYAKNESDVPEPAWRLGASEAAGGLYASLDDMAKWVSFHLDAWPPRDGEGASPLARATRREMHTAGFPVDLEVSSTEKGTVVSSESMGLGWHVRRTCAYDHLVEHGGAVDGFHSQVIFAPDRGFGLVVLSNSIAAGTSSIAERILASIDAKASLEPRSPVFAPAGLEAVGTFTKTLGDFDEAAYARLFSKSFIAHVPLSAMRDVAKKLRDRHGKCDGASVSPSHVESSHDASFRIPCEKGALIAQAHLDEGKLGGFRVESTGFSPKPAQTEAARKVLALAKKWDETLASKLFAKDLDQKKISGALSDLEKAQGSCSLGTGEGDSMQDARFRLTCPRGPATVLRLSTSAEGKVTSIFLSPDETAKKQRCR